MAGVEGKSGYRWVILIICVAVTIVLAAAISVFALALGDISNKFGVSQTIATLGVSLYSLNFVLSQIWGGWLAGRWPLRRSALLVVVLAVVPQLVIPYVTSWVAILVLRFIQGSMGAILPITVPVVARWFPPLQRGLASGILMSSWTLCATVAGVFYGVFYPRVGWEITFVYFGILSVVVSIVFLILIRAPVEEVAEVSAVGAEPGSSPAVERTVRAEMRAQSVYTMGATWLLTLSMFGISWVFFSVYAVIPPFLQGLYGVAGSAQVLSIIGLVGAPATFLGGVVSDAIARGNRGRVWARALTMSIGLGLGVVGFALFPSLAGVAISAAVAGGLLLGWGAPWANGPAWIVPAEVYPPDKVVQATGFMGGIGNVPSIIAPLISVYIGTVLGWHLSFYLGAIVVLIALVCSLALSRVPAFSST